MTHTNCLRREDVDVQGTRLFLRRWGDGTGPNILYWHGGGGAGEEVALPQAIASRGFTAYMPDAPGYGGSPPLKSSAYRPSELATLAASLVDLLGIGPVIWIGSSWGAIVGVHTAVRYPTKINALVLLDAAYVDARDRADYDTSLNLARRTAQLRARYGQGEQWGAAPEFIAKVMHAADEDPCSPYLAGLGATRIPVLLIRATEPAENESARLRGVDRFRSAVPEVDVVPVPGADHFLARANAPAVERIVLEWLARRGIASPRTSESAPRLPLTS